jgi:hypothetical protein
MAHPLSTDVGSILDGQVSHDQLNVTAGGGGDGVAAVGEAIDRQGYDTAAFLVSAEADLAATETLTFGSILIEESDDGLGGWTALDNTGTPANYRTEDLTLTGGAGGSTERGVLQVNAALGSAKRYVRLTFTPDLSAGGVDVARIACVAALSGKLNYE